MYKPALLSGAVFAALAVVLGAFGAHALKETLTPQQLSVYEKGVTYQFYHSFALLATGMLFSAYPFDSVKWASWLFMAGIVLFSGSLYLLVGAAKQGCEHWPGGHSYTYWRAVLYQRLGEPYSLPFLKRASRAVRPFVIARDVFVLATIALLILAGNGKVSWWWLAALAAVYGLILFFGATFIRWNFFISARHQGDRNSKQLALTFDDGPAKHTEDILDILKAESVPAAFFSIGRRAEAAPDIVRRWHEEGHLISNHSYAHSFHFDWQSRTKMVAEIERTNATIKAITGVAPRFFRPPYGVTNPELSHAVTLTSMHTIGWEPALF